MKKFIKYDLVIANPDSDIDLESLMGKYKKCPFFVDSCDDEYIYIDDVDGNGLNFKLPTEAFMLVYKYVEKFYGFKIGDKVYNRETHSEVIIIDFEQYFIDPFNDDYICEISIVHKDDNCKSGFRNTVSRIDDFISYNELRGLIIKDILEDV